jgi:hypothetical protein
MADLVFNIAKGRVVELFSNVDTNNPANSALVIVPVDVAAVSDATLQDFDTLSAILGGGVTERTTNGWTRKTLTDADITFPAPDDTNNRYDIDIADQTWTAVASAGGGVTDLIICYDGDTTAGTDANLIPLTLHDFVITPDGSDVQAIVNAAGFFRAS